MKTRRSAIACCATTWLMLQVPAMIEACPASTTPEPSAFATTSNSPATTGVPAARPVAAAASAVTRPAISVGQSRSGRSARGVGEAVGREQVVVVAAVGEAEQPGAAHVGDVRDAAAGQAEGDEVLAEEGGPGRA